MSDIQIRIYHFSCDQYAVCLHNVKSNITAEVATFRFEHFHRQIGWTLLDASEYLFKQTYDFVIGLESVLETKAIIWEDDRTLVEWRQEK